VITVIEPGPLTSVQDPFGRVGFRRYGVPVGGAADAWSARLANLLAGNDETAAVLEVTLGGLALAVSAPLLVATAGRLAATLDGTPMPSDSSRTLRPGQRLRLDPGDGARGYVAFSGGLVVQMVLGSAATDLRTGFGGHDGRALRAGDRLPVGLSSTRRHRRWVGRRRDGPIRLLPGPHAGIEDLLSETWTVGVEADRSGVRLDGASLRNGGAVPSMGLPLGAIQLPPDGRPIVMLADRPVTGGYRVPACVICADVGRVAQLRTGDVVRFTAVSMEEARAAWRFAEAALTDVEEAGPAGVDPGLGWIGSHD